MLNQGTVTARVNGVPVTVEGAHARAEDEPVAASVVATVRLSVDDLVAALFAWQSITFEDLADDIQARELVVEAVVSLGLSELMEIRERIDDIPAGVNRWLDVCRTRVAQMFGTSPVAGVANDALVGVA